ncbi:hypothetical protein BGZ49_002904, partial [Haplosporangium sp. Z 27]
MLSTVFEDFQLIWANKAATGSKERRKGDGREELRPGFHITKNDRAVLYLEAKLCEAKSEQ